jgi:HSP20 family molecular chaperone IbpA
MIFVRRNHPTLFHPFFLEPDYERYTNVRSFDHDAKSERALSNSGKNVDVEEAETGWTIFMDMPGVKQEDVEIDANDDELVIKAVRKNGDKVLAKYHQNFNLNPRVCNLLAVSADLSDGVLTVTVPKKEAAAPMSVEITVSDPPELPEDESKEFRYTLELPGVKKDAIKLEFRDDTLYLETERKKGRFSAKIERSMTVGPSVDKAQTRAYLMDGVLTLVAPHVEVKKQEARKITLGAVNTSDEMTPKHTE